MVNSPHETHHRAFQEIPELFSRAFRLLGLPDPGPTSVDVLNSDLTEVKPVERRVDTLLRLECEDGGSRVLIVEARTKKDPDKARSWGYYLGFLANKYRHHEPILLVLCRDRATAEWAAGPFRVGHPAGPNLHITPFVLGPDNVPVIGDTDQAVADIPLAVFSALTHSDGPGIGAILETLAAALAKTPNDDLVTVCCDLTASVLADSPAAELWRELMGAGIFGLNGFVAEGLRDEGCAEGRHEGRAENQAANLVKVVEARGIVLPEAAQARIAACRDIGTLDRWFDRALTATTLDDVFRGDIPAAGS